MREISLAQLLCYMSNYTTLYKYDKHLRLMVTFFVVGGVRWGRFLLLFILCYFCQCFFNKTTTPPVLIEYETIIGLIATKYEVTKNYLLYSNCIVLFTLIPPKSSQIYFVYVIVIFNNNLFDCSFLTRALHRLK